MGSFFDEMFNSNNGKSCSCSKCNPRIPDTEVEYLEASYDVEDPEELLRESFELVRGSKNEEELVEAVGEILSKGITLGSKLIIMGDIEDRISMLNTLQDEMGFDDGA